MAAKKEKGKAKTETDKETTTKSVKPVNMPELSVDVALLIVDEVERSQGRKGLIALSRASRPWKEVVNNRLYRDLTLDLDVEDSIVTAKLLRTLTSDSKAKSHPKLLVNNLNFHAGGDVDKSDTAAVAAMLPHLLPEMTALTIFKWTCSFEMPAELIATLVTLQKRCGLEVHLQISPKGNDLDESYAKALRQIQFTGLDCTFGRMDSYDASKNAMLLFMKERLAHPESLRQLSLDLSGINSKASKDILRMNFSDALQYETLKYYHLFNISPLRPDPSGIKPNVDQNRLQHLTLQQCGLAIPGLAALHTARLKSLTIDTVDRAKDDVEILWVFEEFVPFLESQIHLQILRLYCLQNVVEAVYLWEPPKGWGRQLRELKLICSPITAEDTQCWVEYNDLVARSPNLEVLAFHIPDEFLALGFDCLEELQGLKNLKQIEVRFGQANFSWSTGKFDSMKAEVQVVAAKLWNSAMERIDVITGDSLGRTDWVVLPAKTGFRILRDETNDVRVQEAAIQKVLKIEVKEMRRRNKADHGSVWKEYRSVLKQTAKDLFSQCPGYKAPVPVNKSSKTAA